MILDLAWIILFNLVDPKSRIMGSWGVGDVSTNPENPESQDVRIFKVFNDQCYVKENDYISILGHPIVNIIFKNSQEMLKEWFWCSWIMPNTQYP